MPFKDHFQTLRVSHRSTSQEIQKAYHERLKFFHPDFYETDPGRRAIAELETKSLNEAYEALAKDQDRERYLREWERHQNPPRPSVEPTTLDDALVQAKAEAASARERLAELQVTLDQRTRELEAARLQLRQGHERVQQAQHSLEAYQDNARRLEARLLECSVELEQLHNEAQSRQAQIRQLEDAVRGLTGAAQVSSSQAEAYRRRIQELETTVREQRLEIDRLQRERGASPGERMTRREPVAARNADALASALPESTAIAAGDAATSKGADARASQADCVEAVERELAAARLVVQEQGTLLEEAARQLQTWQRRAQAAESELRTRRASASECDPDASQAQGAPGGQDGPAGGTRGESAEGGETVREATLTTSAEAGYVGRRAATTFGQPNSAASDPSAGWRHHLTVGLDRAAAWFVPSRATAIVGVLLVALCGLALVLIVLTDLPDQQALRSTLGRVGAWFASVASR
jgi:curved DNA-binding protein CbpA